MRAHLRPYHYMLPPYKGRRPDGHTRRPSRTLPCFWATPLCVWAVPCCHRSTWRVRNWWGSNQRPSTTLRPQDLKTVALPDC
jgi:hypothetical protein